MEPSRVELNTRELFERIRTGEDERNESSISLGSYRAPGATRAKAQIYYLQAVPAIDR